MDRHGIAKISEVLTENDHIREWGQWLVELVSGDLKVGTPQLVGRGERDLCHFIC